VIKIVPVVKVNLKCRVKLRHAANDEALQDIEDEESTIWKTRDSNSLALENNKKKVKM